MRQSLLGSGPSLYKRRTAGTDLFRLGAPVGPGAFNQEDDTDKVAGLLAGAGHLETLKPDRDSLIEATRRYQKAAGLKVDGLLNPGGPTITALSQPGAKAPGLTPPASEMRGGLARLSPERRAKNGRDAESLAVSPGSLFTDHLAGLWHLGDNGKAEVVNLMDQLTKHSAPAAGKLSYELAPRIPAAERGLFHAARVLGELEAKDEDGPDNPQEPAESNEDVDSLIAEAEAAMRGPTPKEIDELVEEVEAKRREGETVEVAENHDKIYLNGDEHPKGYILTPDVATDKKGHKWGLPDEITGKQLRETINKYGLPEEPILDYLKSTEIRKKGEFWELLKKLNLGMPVRPRNPK